MGTNTRTLALAIVCALISALVLAACGGGGDDSTSSAAATTPGSTSGTETSNEGGSGSGGSENSSGGSGSNSSSGDSSSGGGSGVGGTNLKSSERSSKFVVPGGDNSIQEFGGEGDSGERAEALKVVEAVSQGTKTGNWTEVCNKYLSAKNLEQFEMVAAKIPKFKGKSCSELLGGLSPGSTEKNPTQPKEGIASVRNDGTNAFAIYVGVDGNSYAFPFAIEGGSFKATALAPTPLSVG